MLDDLWWYTLKDLRAGDDPQEWAQELADEGWRMWPPRTGVLVTINGEQVRRYSLRRWVEPGEARGPASGSF